jgi:tetratricopeptide (TPR) repeat protein
LFSPWLRIVLAVMGSMAALLAFLAGRWLLGSAYLLAAALFLHGQRRYATVWRAFRAFRDRDMKRVETLLEQVDKPDRLYPRHRAAYDWMQGVLAADRGDFEEARMLLKGAVEGAIRTDQNRSIIHFHLAEVAKLQGDTQAARDHLGEAKKLTNDPELKDLIAAQEERLG